MHYSIPLFLYFPGDGGYCTKKLVVTKGIPLPQQPLPLLPPSPQPLLHIRETVIGKPCNDSCFDVSFSLSFQFQSWWSYFLFVCCFCLLFLQKKKKELKRTEASGWWGEKKYKFASQEGRKRREIHLFEWTPTPHPPSSAL